MAARAASGGPSFEALIEQNRLDPDALHALAERFASAHAHAAPASAAGVASFRAAIAAAAVLPAQQAELDRHTAKLDARARMDRIRMLAGEPGDVLHDLALPLMELWRSGRAIEANILANRYCDVAPQGATGWAMLPLYVSLHATRQGDADFAAEVLEPVPARLIAIAGLSGTGKTTLARIEGARHGRVPGARILRSDVFRKRIVGHPPEHRLPPSHYTPASDQATYEALFESADDHLACGTSVILDAVFMRRGEREVIEVLAMRRDVPFAGIWLEAPERDRVARVTARTGDASDAGAEVAREQSRRPVGELSHWHRIRANRPIELIVAAARTTLDRKPR